MNGGKKRGSLRRGRLPGELTPKGCRQYRCNQMGVDNKSAVTRQPLKHRRLHESKHAPFRLI